MERRSFLSLIAGAAGAAAAAAVGIPVVRRLLAPLRRAPGTTSAQPRHVLGRVDDFPLGTPRRVVFPVTLRDGWQVVTQDRAAWVVRTGDDAVTVLSTVCPHLGCSVRWQQPSGTFSCPCHASAFGLDGARSRGPARRGLDELPTEVVDGEIRVAWVEYIPDIAERRPLGDPT